MSYITIDNKQINITHEDKLLFPEVGITKKDLINYYLNIADYLLPLIKDRPLTINCFPQGINESGYYRQNAPKDYPDWLTTIELKKKNGRYMTHILCQDKSSLVYLINNNTITIHRWLSKYKTPNYPDIMIIDIDTYRDRFDLACKGAKLLRIEAKKLGYKSFVMSTGSKGLHVILPIINAISFEEAKTILNKIVSNIVLEFPHEFTTNISKNKRENCTYLDLFRNAYGQTAVAPYSVRAYKEASVATPLHWSELEDPDFHPRKYTINNIFARLQSLQTDPWSYFSCIIG